jgi:acyl-CoA dehydrogenase
MDFAYTPKVEELRSHLIEFMQNHVLPAEQVAAAHHDQHLDHWGAPPVMAELKAEARHRGLWNLALPADSRGAGLTNLEYAPLAEITGWSPLIAPEALNCSSPDTGNMEILSRFGTSEQQRRWLEPLLEGEIRSIFSMTEPAVASSDANNVRLEIREDDDEWVLNCFAPPGCSGLTTGTRAVTARSTSSTSASRRKTCSVSGAPVSASPRRDSAPGASTIACG